MRYDSFFMFNAELCVIDTFVISIKTTFAPKITPNIEKLAFFLWFEYNVY